MKAEAPDPLLYFRRPDNTAIWLPLTLAGLLRLKRGDTLTSDQMSTPAILHLLDSRNAKKRKAESEE